MSKVFGKEPSMNLYKTILELKDLDECYRFFQDLCTVSELRAMEQRFDVAVLLQKGMIYNDILEQTGASSATISRVNRALNYGVEGYHQVFARTLGEEYVTSPAEKLKKGKQKK
ncbi:MAG: YerC/YecD family TrpR-related protein [Candidatus Onthomonas sp.]|nr:YerC/YecD family TrpR-related protein [Candidatus Onthomonas sp.]